MDAEIQRAAEAKRQAVRRALSEDERRHARQVALWAMAGLVVVVIGGIAVVARLV